ncbi:MAG: TetR/AcrR family transcriptional regulator [Pseudomonadota bacterium]
MNETAEKIMDAAERRVRSGGYGAMSFRDLAAEIGIKSSSVHYHFPTKEALASTLVERYTARLKTYLDDEMASERSTREKLAAFVDYYRKALELDHSICLCVMLGAESIELPVQIKERVQAFYETGERWLEELFEVAGKEDPRTAAAVTLASLSGAMVVASTANDREQFEKTARFLEKLI